MILIFALFLLCIVSSLTAIRFGISYALAHSITDNPGETHKLHNSNTPFVGGLGVLAALFIVFTILATFYPNQMQQWLALGLCSLTIFVAGFIDDTRRLSYKTRLVIQAFVAFVMVWVGGIVLDDLGELFFGLPLQLGLFAIPFTIFSVVGCINALNMIDGIDGLSGSISLISLFLISVVALFSNNSQIVLLSVTLAGGVVGFLYFNLRYPTQKSARVFLGDNGSMLLGLLLAWILIDLSQGPNAAIEPVTALWLFGFPLLDTISVIHRRLSDGKSAFAPDFNHLHHILLKAGFQVEGVVLIIALLHALLGIIGIISLYQDIPSYIMFAGFFAIYAGYFYLTLKPWRFIPTIHYLYLQLGFVPVANKDTFSGKYTAREVRNLSQIVSDTLGPNMNFWLKTFKQHSPDTSTNKHYAVALNIRLPKTNNTSEDQIQQYLNLLQQHLKTQKNIWLRQFIGRYHDYDRRVRERRSGQSMSCTSDRRLGDRRASQRRNLDNIRRSTQERRSVERRSVERRSIERRSTERRVADQHRLDANQVLVFEITNINQSPGSWNH